MSKSFDDILKEGKKKVTGTSGKKREWRKRVNALMEELHLLNRMYGNDSLHHLHIEQVKCKKCKIVSYTIVVRDFDNPDKLTRFHKSKWLPVGSKGVTYYCSKCRK